MKPTGVEYFVYPEKGGLIRDPDTIASHLQPGAANAELLQNTVELTLTADLAADGELLAEVAITNTEAGHHVPTDYPGRQMILVVTARDEEGDALALADGPTLPAWCGDQAGEAGVAYAKVLRDVETGESPAVNYWKQTLIESDNRLAALEADRSTFRFAAPAEGDCVEVSAVVLFRRLYQDLAREKGWETPDITMEEATVRVSLP